MTIPNLISVLRLFLVPLIIWLLLDGDFVFAFWAFLIAGLSDAADGFIARHFSMQSDLGTYLDPLADKALLVSVFIALGVMGHIPIWIVIVVVSRDILIVGGVLLAWMLDQPVEMKPLIVSKANTVFQIVFVCLIVADLALASDFLLPRQILGYVVALTTLISAGFYVMGWMNHMSHVE